MHSSIGPWEEARQIYLAQSDLKSRLFTGSGTDPLVVYDVGMGIAANALVLLDGIAKVMSRRPRPVHLISFESELSGLRMALEQAPLFPFMSGREEMLAGLLRNRKWVAPGGGIRWELREGDFFDHLPACPAPELIYYDFFSPKSTPGLWGLQAFQRVHQACALSGPGTLLLTYSASTPIRVALLLAGFFVGRGIQTAVKKETTAAATRPDALQNPLGAEWLAHYERSARKLPLDGAELDAAEVRRMILEHPQFR